MGYTELTKVQSEVLSFIAWHITEWQRPPTRREIADSFGWKSNNAAEDVIQALQAKGHIELTGSVGSSQWQRYVRVVRWPQNVLPIICLTHPAVA